MRIDSVCNPPRSPAPYRPFDRGQPSTWPDNASPAVVTGPSPSRTPLGGGWVIDRPTLEVDAELRERKRVELALRAVEVNAAPHLGAELARVIRPERLTGALEEMGKRGIADKAYPFANISCQQPSARAYSAVLSNKIGVPNDKNARRSPRLPSRLL